MLKQEPMGAKSSGPGVSLGTNGAGQLGEDGCGHAVGSKMAAACEEHGGGEFRILQTGGRLFPPYLG